MLPKFPSTRYQGSKRKVLNFLYSHLDELEFSTSIDLYSGSGAVTLMFRLMGKTVWANDYLPYSANTAGLLLKMTNDAFPTAEQVERDLAWMLYEAPISASLIADNFQGIYFLDEENIQLDRFCQNQPGGLIGRLYAYAVGQAIIRKRPFGLFHRANLSVRTTQIERSFGNSKTWENSIYRHAIDAIDELRWFHFPSKPNKGDAFCTNTKEGLATLPEADLVYLDPPYVDDDEKAIDYADFYHFLSGIIDYQKFGEIDRNRKHRPIRHDHTHLATCAAIEDEIHKVLARWPAASLAFSYRSDGRPGIFELQSLLSENGRTVAVRSIPQQYVLSRQRSREVILISVP